VTIAEALVRSIELHGRRGRRFESVRELCKKACGEAPEKIDRRVIWRRSLGLVWLNRVRDECLNINMFWSLAQARVMISDRKEDYNHRRRLSALGYQAPAVYAAARTHH
jgi:transposase InsO family protein